MAEKPLEIREAFGSDNEGQYIASVWENYRMQMNPKIEQWKELRNYIFATDTTTTTNKSLPWKNSTTLPKLCQIRDNLHSNYLSALFPNDEWLKWQAYSASDASKQKVKAIEAYMSNKTREGYFRTEMSKLLYDYIDYGNAFATVVYEAAVKENNVGDKVNKYVGPKLVRISPMDIVFNPIATSFNDSFKIIRSVRNIGELHAMAEDQPDNAWLREALRKRNELCAHANAYGLEMTDKDEGFQMDGFGNYWEYLQSGYVEMLTFYGDYYDAKTQKLERNMEIVVIDRMYVINKQKSPSWTANAPIFHTGWRLRPDNIWAMGPLDNLVGMQYRIDHLENLKSDAMDLAVLPPLVIAGDVEQFNYGPGEEIHLDEGGTVTELARNVQWVLQADNSIDRLEARMEQYAGAPREAMGIRSPGEKTAFEVQQLENAGGRIFQEKITTFETELLERALNGMLELARRNMDHEDVVRVIDDDLGVTDFMKITREDITAAGVLRPIGARHFAAQSQLLQNLSGVFNGPLGQVIGAHASGKQVAKLVEDVLGLSRWSIFQPNAAVFEQQETKRLAGQAEEDLQAEAAVPVQPQ